MLLTKFGSITNCSSEATGYIKYEIYYIKLIFLLKFYFEPHEIVELSTNMIYKKFQAVAAKL